MKNTYFLLNDTEVIKLTEAAYIALHAFSKLNAVRINVEYSRREDSFVLEVWNNGERQSIKVNDADDIRGELWKAFGNIGFDGVTNGQNKELARRVVAYENVHVFITQKKAEA